ncbi:hypothetical protein GYMLUDRAFT_234983 [Collybiopsis luxurians FD-317 M1]|nr:hypothetical protein GYMLUDRAFT_234983 [Collybiopsis luxurians FD-317 M1]
MAQALISNFPRSINFEPRIKWSTVQEDGLNRDYPFTGLDHENPDQFVVRTYLQFLWLPESIMPLNSLVPSMQRVQVASASPESLLSPHPLHALLDPILLTARASANKYQVELPKILDNEGGDGEIEEAMMWYALSFEKASENDKDLPIWMNEKWRTKWIRRMERREVHIQILLNFLILSLPGTRPLPPEPEIPQISSVKRRKRPIKKAARVSTPEERLESFMDKLSMMQLMGDLEDSNDVVRAATKPKDELNWAQSFCQNTIEPLFQSTLPTFCELFRSKVFPDTLFSDNEIEEDNDDSQQSDRADTSEPIRDPSPALSTTSTSSQREPSRRDSSRQLQRSRSRSLSVSLADEAEQKARQGISGTNKRRVLSREVSMSFKSKGKPSSTSSATTTSFLVLDNRREHERKPVKREPTATVLVEATPVKPARTASISQIHQSQSHPTLFSRSESKLSMVGEEEEFWELPGSSSPDVLSLTPVGGVDITRAVDKHPIDVLEGDGVVSTPTKAKRKRS